jgi:hypothetical protein
MYPFVLGVGVHEEDCLLAESEHKLIQTLSLVDRKQGGRGVVSLVIHL